MPVDCCIFINQLGKRSKLFHYTSAAGFKGICEGEIWATMGHFLNDPTEFQIGTEIFCEVMDKHVSNKKVCDKFKELAYTDLEQINNALKDIYGGVYVASFSLGEDNPLLWSEFSSNTGYCLKFDFKKLYSAIKYKINSENNGIEIVFLHGKVIYNHDKQVKKIEKTFKDGYFNNKRIIGVNSWEDFNSLTDEKIEELYEFIGYNIYLYNFFFKNQLFAGEKEYRFLFIPNQQKFESKEKEDTKPSVISYQPLFRIKKEVMLPYIKIEYLSHLPNPLEEIMIGPMNQMDIALSGAKCFLKCHNLDIPVTKSKIPLRY